MYGGNKDTNMCLTLVPRAHGVDPHVKTNVPHGKKISRQKLNTNTSQDTSVETNPVGKNETSDIGTPR